MAVFSQMHENFVFDASGGVSGKLYFLFRGEGVDRLDEADSTDGNDGQSGA